MEPEVARELGNGGRRGFAAPSPAGVGLGDDEAHLVLGGEEAAQDGGGELGGAGESYLQGASPGSGG